ncbi:hypothetical protein PMAC_000310 [Pneumocystis sp. 'macacae']|nr:hypothetical protein PMAC_000310 [Pneumocystis sp. 'macacae']
MTQTPRQRHANEIYAMREAAKRGKSKTEKPVFEKRKLGISIYWACAWLIWYFYLLIFLAVEVSERWLKCYVCFHL